MKVSVNNLGIKIGNEMILKSSMNNTQFAMTLRGIFSSIETIEVEPKDHKVVKEFLANYSILVPTIRMAIPTPVATAASTPAIITGAGANQTELPEVDVTIYRDSYFGAKNWWYVNAIDNRNGDKFSYYLNLNNMKRYYKEGETPSNFLRLDDLANLELQRLGLSPEASEDEIKAQAKTRILKKKVA